MLKKILIPMFVALLCWLSLTSYAGLTANAPRPEQVVAEFQKLPHYEMFCKDERWRGVVPAKLKEKYNNFFSKEFYKIFLWSECVDPKYPPHYGGLYKALYFDIRFSIPYQDLYLRKNCKFCRRYSN